VRIWASIVQWVHSDLSSSIDSSANSFLLPNNEIHSLWEQSFSKDFTLPWLHLARWLSK
jgi:hypothetical protein